MADTLDEALRAALAGLPGDAPVVVHLGPATLASARLDDALAACVDQTRRAVDDAAASGAALVLCSTLAAVGRKKGLVPEEDPRRSPFGGSTTRGSALDLEAEVAACARAVDYARRAAAFADVRSRLADETRQALVALGGASSGSAFARAFDEACAREERALLERALVERAAGWSFATGSAFAVRGYACALAELVAADACEERGVPLAIVRVPDVLDGDDGALAWLRDHSRDAPFSASPVAEAARLEALPRTDVARAIALVARGLASSREGGVVHVVAPEPLTGARLADLLDLHRRRVSRGERRDAVERAREAVDVVRGALDEVRGVDPAARARGSSPPFFSDETRFAQRALRLSSTRAGVVFQAAAVSWRPALLDEHLPALDERHAARAQAKRTLPRPAWDHLGHLLAEVAERWGNRPALSLFSGDDVVDVTYAELHARAAAAARRLRAAGLERGGRVVVAGQNHPAWGITAFGVVLAGGVCVPLDPGLEEDAVARIVKKARPTLAVVDKAARAKWSGALPEPVLDLQLTATTGPALDDSAASVAIAPDDVASILFTSGTTGDPKGVELTHKNFCALLSSLQAIFPVGRGDRLLSVLPLHHTFEFSCGFLMPLAAGARIYTPDALTGERVLYALKTGKITAMVGVPALWQLLERRIQKQAAERGDVVKSVLDALLAANRALGRRTGRSIGRIALKPIHDELGGHLKTLISGGSALPPSVHELFQGLGLPLAEGYGLTEAAPVLTVAEGVLGAPAGTVGRPIPGVELRIVDPDPTTGAGEIWARAPNVMRGYFEDPSSTGATLVDGWLKTGDLGKIDDEGRLRILGRSKDVVVTAAGENIYLDDIEKKLEQVDGVAELTLLGLADPRGGERLALAWVVAPDAAVDDAQKSLQQRILKLPAFARPAVVERVEGPLPLTATRKVKRKDVKKALEERLAAREAEATGVDEAPMSAVRAAIALVAGVEAKKLTGSTRLPQDLGFDSLMWTELGAALSPLAGALDPELLVAQESVSALENLVRQAASEAARAPVHNAALDDERATRPARARPGLADLALAVAKPLGRAAITVAQREAYRTIFKASVSGRAFIPANRSAIVVANHTSHLDTGLVKFALGDYGRDLRPLAAKDYFFEGARPKVAFFEHFTNLVPIDRETGSGLAFEQARAVVDGGHTVLIFPEGTRREDGTLGAFKPLVGRLSLATGKDVLPLWMKGNYDALPRGSLIPNLDARDLEAHIGPPLLASEMRRLTAHLPPVQQARAATDIIRRAVVALSEGKMLELSRARSLDELERGVVARPAA